MNQPPHQRLETQLTQAARDFPYPPTPDIASQVGRQSMPAQDRMSQPRMHLVWIGLLALAIMGGGLLASPPVRATLLEFLQIGAVRIWLVTPTPTPALSPTVQAPRPTATPLTSVLDLAGETTLAEAERQVKFPLRLPTYPADLGPPDKVYRQDMAGQAVIFIWLQKSQPTQVRMSLHLLTNEGVAWKMGAKVLTETTVLGHEAAWTAGPYIILNRYQDWQPTRLIQGHVLIWRDGILTYRLETDLPLPEAKRVAESLR